MFDRIAGRYDLVNTVLTAGADARWRRHAAQMTRLRRGGSAVDIACGSGTLTAELARLAGSSGRVVGIDFSDRMLEVARRRNPSLEFIRGDALDLPFRDAQFQVATMAFGLRNLADPRRGLREMVRVAARAVVLEFVKPPPTAFGHAYRVYLRSVVPMVGAALTGDRAAYRYLSDTVDHYLLPEELEALAEAAGWRRRQVLTRMGGTVAVLAGDAP
jgi:demethylmenaquinone methyltransferase/2-methoxy-6-polyprenyl-1,4-benzoquinol methylase